MASFPLVRLRQRFAERVRDAAHLGTPALVRGLATVPREEFVGPGPWQLLRPSRLGHGYETTPDDDPRHLYDFVLVALDANRNINNGEPSSLLRWLDALALAPGDRFLHIGCGVGYYTAIAATAVLPGGSVVGVEADLALMQRAARNLESYPQLRVLSAQDLDAVAGTFDAVFVNAGATAVLPSWLDRLAPNGRLLVPLTVTSAANASVGFGQMLLVTRDRDAHRARFVSPVGIFHCVGARSDAGNERLAAAFARGDCERVTTLRRDAHAHSDRCWLHTDDTCLCA